jgi:hypothetical protein
MSQFTPLHLVSSRFVAAYALAAGVAAVSALVGCAGSDEGEEQRRPQVLTPTLRQPSDVTPPATEMTPTTNPTSAMPVMMGPPPTPAGTPDAEGYISGPPQECNGPNLATTGALGTPAPADGLLLSFTSYLPAGTWGDASVGQITGGTSLYQLVPEGAITQSVLNGGLQIRADVAPGGYSGIVLWFGPCVNASAFGGVQFSATGDLSGASMIVKVQTSPDYPIDIANTKGKCRFKVDANKFSECVQPSATVTALETNPIALPWASFTGGAPVAIDPSQLLGFELQFQCPAAATENCALDMNLGNISFSPL